MAGISKPLELERICIFSYFQQQLIDFDVSSNWCNWAYIAGVGNNPRGKSHFNIQKQADQFDADYAFRQLWLKHSI